MGCKRPIGQLAITTIFCGSLLSFAYSAQPAASSPLLQSQRHSSSDLEVAGRISGVPSSTHWFISYQSLLSLPQVETTILEDVNFTELHTPQVRVSGVELSVLARIIGVEASSNMMNALCVDRYQSQLPAEYVAAHRPILVLKINGLPTSQWAAQTNNEDPGPFMITYPDFKPSFQVLAHQDMPQEPTEMYMLSFGTQKDQFGPITPAGHFPSNSPVMLGFAIAKQNCLRCHNQGTAGGTKAGRTWSTLAAYARHNPTDFSNYVHNPQHVDTKATMPGNPTYDQATLAAITAYFQAFSSE